MVFSSLFFLYAFLPLCLLAYALCRSLKAKNICLLVFSLIFYTWGEPKYVLLLMLMSFFDWFFARRIQLLKNRGAQGQKKWVVFACVVNLGLIGIFKYSRMICSTIGYVPEFVTRITLPLGISFYTFQLLSYVIDVYRGEAEAQEEYWHVLLFAALYHQCIAGPIVRYKTIAHELFTERSSLSEIGDGCFRFAVGLAKKVILANACGELADALILSEAKLSDAGLLASNIEVLSAVPVAGLWIGLAAATLQIYFDFSAYSDMAIGMGKMFGLHYPENFNYPYISKTAGEYWRRWHMTLGSWFRDYLYYPLTLGPALKIRKAVTKRTSRKTGIFVQNLFTMVIVWACTGLWHGASWSFVLWGLYWCFFMILEQNFLQKWLEKLPGFVSHIYMILILLCSRALFRFGNLRYTLTILKGMLGLNHNAFSDFTTGTLFKNYVFLLAFCVIAATPLIKMLLNRLKAFAERTSAGKAAASFTEYALIPVSLLLISTAALVGASYNPFLYFRF